MFHLHLEADLHSCAQYFTSDLSYINNALIRPIVAFINRNRTLIPIHCHIDLGLSEFNGSWTTYDVGILDRMSEQVRFLSRLRSSLDRESALADLGADGCDRSTPRSRTTSRSRTSSACRRSVCGRSR